MAWAKDLHLTQFTMLRGLHEGVGDVRLANPLFLMLDQVRRGAWEFGYADAGDYIEDMHALAALDYPSLVLAPPDSGWPTAREALRSLIWPISGLPLESYGMLYVDALLGWLRGRSPEHAPGYTGPGTEELREALETFCCRSGYIEDTRWEREGSPIGQ